MSFELRRMDAPFLVERWFRRSIPPDRTEPFLSSARVDGGYLLRFHDSADFWVRRDGTEIIAFSRDQALDTIEQLLLDQVLPQTLTLRGLCCLHASCVSIGGRGVVLVGDTGQGKSTLASALAPPGLLVSDDCLALRCGEKGVVAFPSYPSVRLRPDSATRLGVEGRPVSARMTWKTRIETPFEREPVELARVYLLGRSESTSISELSPVVGLRDLLRHVHRLDPEDRASLDSELSILSTLVERTAPRRLSFPHRYDRLEAVRNALLEDLEETLNFHG